MGKIRKLLMALVIGTKTACEAIYVKEGELSRRHLSKEGIIATDGAIEFAHGLGASTLAASSMLMRTQQDHTEVEYHQGKGQIAYVLRGESFRTPRKSGDIAQGGPAHRNTCGPGADATQKSLSQQQLGHVKFLESLGFGVTLMGTTYECSGSVPSYTVAEALPKLYDGRLNLDLQDKATSSQLTGLRRALQIVKESGKPYDYVILNRFDNGYPFDRWACWLSKGLDWLEDMDSLNGPGKNSDVTFVIPEKHIDKFNEFIGREDSACCSVGGQCEVACNGCRNAYLREMFNVTDQSQKVLEQCPGENAELKQAQKYVDPFDGLPVADRECLQKLGLVK